MLFWSAVRSRRIGGFKFRRQLPIGRYFADFACLEAQLVVELDGPSHDDSTAYDERRAIEIERCGWRVVRFRNEAVLKDLEGVLRALRAELDLGRP